MIGYLMLGTNDLEKAVDFYDELFFEMGATRAYETGDSVVWKFGDGPPLFCITKPYDGNPATVGNGVMVALNVGDTDAVDALHTKALALGATSEGDPGPRGKMMYAAYFRDIDGNKLNIHCYT